jgi:hypothetical protein
MKKLLIIPILISCDGNDINHSTGTGIKRNTNKEILPKNKNNLKEIKNTRENQIDKKVNEKNIENNSEKEYEEIYKQKIKELLEKLENEKDNKIKNKIEAEITKLFLNKKLYNGEKNLGFVETILEKNSENDANNNFKKPYISYYFPLNSFGIHDNGDKKKFLEKKSIIETDEKGNIIVKYKINIERGFYKIYEENIIDSFKYRCDVTYTFYKEGGLSGNVSYSEEENDLNYLKEKENNFKKYNSNFNIQQFIKYDLLFLNKKLYDFIN